MTDFVRLGYNILTPYGDCEPYDYVIDTKKGFIRIQCKTAQTEDDGASFSFGCRSNHRKGGKIVHHKYTKDEIDYFATHFQGVTYLIPVEECGATKRLRILPAKDNQDRGVSWAKDYVLEEVVKTWEADV